MRTIRRLGTAMAITILVAGVAASCALPPYEASGSSSGASGSGGNGATSGSLSASSGQTAQTSASSSKSSSSTGGLVDGGDDGGGPDCPPVMVCAPIDHLGAPCACDKSVCFGAMCLGDSDASAMQGLYCDNGLWVSVMASIECCPNQPHSCGNSTSACLFGVTPGPQSVPTHLTTICKTPACGAGKPLDCNCFPTDPCKVLFGTQCSSVDPVNGNVFCSP